MSPVHSIFRMAYAARNNLSNGRIIRCILH